MAPERTIVRTFLTAVAAASGALTALIPALAQSPSGPDWVDWQRLDNGEILFESRNADERGTATIRVAVAIEADWRVIWELITACEISPEFVPHVVACSRIESTAEGDSELFKQTVKPAFFLPRFEHVFQLDYFPPERVEVSHISGPIERLEGTWRLLERPDGRIALIHEMTVNPAFPVPRFFVRNTLERDLPDVLAEIRRRAEAAAD
jgi:ribosome-associated toxin RatA of RatAB toxin-antitoxin module